MFEPKKEEHTIRGQKITIRELEADVLANMDEAMSAAVAASLVPEKTQAEVAQWPASVVTEIFKHISALNGWDDEGKD
jgi:hypothetical protein|tara:strand:- start:425 stop:658 length:234 start_codon:yes stop_codon:yes gene_type:complete